MAYQLPDSSPYAAKLNPGLKQSDFQSKASILNARITEYGDGSVRGNSLYGQMIPGTQIPYNSASQLQLLIWNWYSEQGMQTPQNFESLLKEPVNVGPLGINDWWNYSVGEGGFGLDGTQLNVNLQVVSFLDKKTAKEYQGYVI